MSDTCHAELEAFLVRHPDTRFLDAVMFDLVGNAIGKRYPMRDAAKVFEDGVAFCAGITTLDAQGACWDVNGIGFSDGDPDAVSMPVPGTLVPVPWAQHPTAQVLIAPRHAQDPAGEWFDPRAILARVLRRFEPLGLVPVVACELEFYLVARDRSPDGTLRPAVPPSTGRANEAPRVLGYSKLDEWSDFLADVDAACVA
jgi:glutamine synthetase